MVRVTGTVRNWDYNNSVIEFLKGEEIWKLSIDSREAMITVTSKADKSKIIMLDRMDKNGHGELFTRTKFHTLIC